VARRGIGLVVVAAVLLSGCAQAPLRQAMDPAAAARLRAVLVAQPPNQQRFGAGFEQAPPLTGGGPPALALLQLGILLVAIADAQHRSTQLTTAVDPVQARPQERLGEMLRAGLEAQGFEARVAVVPALGAFEATVPKARRQIVQDALPALRQQGQADAVLVFLLLAQVAPDSGADGYCPVLTVTAQGVDLASGATLYEDSFEYGCASPRPGWRLFSCAPACRFESFDAVLADPARLRASWHEGLRLIADAILLDVGRRAPRYPQ
jgi:hypothetical protein